MGILRADVRKARIAIGVGMDISIRYKIFPVWDAGGSDVSVAPRKRGVHGVPVSRWTDQAFGVELPL